MTAARKTRVAIIFGGRSSEHAVSCVTAAGVLDAIDRDKYDVVPIGIAPDGQWTLAADDVHYSLAAGKLPEVDSALETVTLSHQAANGELLATAPAAMPRSLGEVDVVLPLLHGPFGEDGSLQGLLEMADIRYVGAGVLASAVGMDKQYTKIVFAAAGLEVGPYEVITDRQWANDRDGALIRAGKLDFPVFVKPARAGSSVGITRVESADGLADAVETAREHDPKVLVEAGIAGREIEVAVLQGRGTDAPRVSLPGEVEVAVGEHTFYDFEAKYVDGAAAALSCPAKLDDAAIEQVRALAADAFDAVAGEGLARVDFFYTPDGQFIINEINTMPGFTPISMFPQMWAASGIGYTDLIDELLQLALKRNTGLR